MNIQGVCMHQPAPIHTYVLVCLMMAQKMLQGLKVIPFSTSHNLYHSLILLISPEMYLRVKLMLFNEIFKIIMKHLIMVYEIHFF